MRIQIGHILCFCVVKAMPDYDAYLTFIKGNEMMALLPKNFAGREYKIKDTGWAAVFNINGGRVTLSQKSPHYIRKMIEYLLRDTFSEHNIRIKKVAQTGSASFCKVAVETELSHNELFKLFKTHTPKNIKNYITGTITPVKFSENDEEYIINALTPAPREQILKVILIEDMKKATVYVNSKYIGFFLGANGQNVAGAAKLTDYDIEIRGVSIAP